MQNLRRLNRVLTACVLVISAHAYGDDQEPTLTPDQQECPPSADQTTCPPPAQDQTMAPEQEQQTMAPDQTAPQTTTTTTTTGYPPPVVQPGSTAMGEEQYERPWYETMGIGLSVGGGVDDFVGDAMRDTTSIGGSWNVRMTFGTHLPLAAEASYIGSAQSINALGLDDDAVLVGNGLQGALRLNVLPKFAVQPFLYGGAAWRHYDLTNTNFNTSDVRDSDDVFEVPVGVGIAGYIMGFMADVRAEYRGAWGSDLIPNLRGGDDNTIIGEADRWGVNASIGASF
jgi:hypothetical protein